MIGKNNGLNEQNRYREVTRNSNSSPLEGLFSGRELMGEEIKHIMTKRRHR
jgi:hypothetical protein